MKNLIIIGARKLGREVYSLAKQINSSGNSNWQIKGFLDDNESALDNYKYNCPIISSVESYHPVDGDVFISALGDGKHRKHFAYIMEGKGAEFINLIHPTAIISDGVEMGLGNVIGPQVHISNDVTIGNHTLIQTNAILGHDVVFLDYCTAGAFVFVGGGAEIDQGAYLATRSTILPNAKVGSFAIVGASSLVLKKVSKNTKVFGMPAIILK